MDNKVFTCLNCEDVTMDNINCANKLIINQCGQCGGIWLDKGELNDLQVLGDFYIDSLDDTGKPVIEKNRIRKCPVCKLVLEPIFPPKWEGLKIDRCKGCGGIWLDRGELKKLCT